jgi:hypothetical protein
MLATGAPTVGQALLTQEGQTLTASGTLSEIIVPPAIIIFGTWAVEPVLDAQWQTELVLDGAWSSVALCEGTLEVEALVEATWATEAVVEATVAVQPADTFVGT